MSSRFIFPYGVRFQENGRIETFPAADIIVLGRNKKGLRAIFHIDSGATTSVLPGSDAEALEINIEAGIKTVIRGVSGEPITGYKHIIIIQFDNHKIKIPAIFTENNLIPRILGREGFFNYFGVLFHENKNRVVFLDERKERKIINSLFEN